VVYLYPNDLSASWFGRMHNTGYLDGEVTDLQCHESFTENEQSLRVWKHWVKNASNIEILSWFVEFMGE
jgi:hypothetical protein